MEFQFRTHPRAKKLTLRLDKTGQAVVTAPRFTPKLLAKHFVQKNQDWILKKQQEFNSKRDQFVTDTHLTLFGKKYLKKVSKNTATSKVTIQGKTLLISLHKTKKLDTILNQFLKNTATHYIAQRTQQLAQKMKVTYGKITLRQQRTRWGSCSSQGNLNFNWRLVHFSPKIIDYVIIHELAHRQHLNHSAKFWQYVKRYDPEYKLHQGWLNRQGIGVH